MPTFQTPNRWRRYNATPGAHQRRQRAREADLRDAAALIQAAPVVERADSATAVVECGAGNMSDNAALAAPAVPPEWQPIETAPVYPFVKERWYVDGPRYLLSTGSSVFIGQYGYTERGKGRWQDHYGRICQPTHWMPLTAAPTAQQEPKP